MSIISKNIRSRYQLSYGNHCVIDDYCYFSSRIVLGDFFHIGPNCSITGGKDTHFTAGSFGGIAAGVNIFCGTDNFVDDICTVLPEICEGIRQQIKGDTFFGDYVTIGSGTVIMPNNNIPEGVTIGAMSFVPYAFQFKPWSVYFGNPLKFYTKRNKERVLKQAIEIQKRVFDV